MIILQDTAEKLPWNFNIYTNCSQEKYNLTTGDYTVRGCEHLLAIERKRSTGEIAINLGQKWKQFESEFKRMEPFPHKYLICEFPFDDLIKFPENSGIPKKAWGKIRMNGKFLTSRLMRECDKYGIEIIFCNNKNEAQSAAYSIFKEVYEKNRST
jgi:hypothetical protein